MKKLGIAALMAITLVGFQANAGFMFEPFVQYETGDDSDGDDASGNTFGLRLAYTMLGFQLGADYRTGTITVEDTGGDTDADTTDLGLFVGYELPIMFRVYAIYGLSHEATPDGSSSDFEGDGGITLGVSYTGLPFININIEQSNRTFDKFGSVDTDYEVDTTVIGVSLPLP